VHKTMLQKKNTTSPSMSNISGSWQYLDCQAASRRLTRGD
jgi:hypothetical protein